MYQHAPFLPDFEFAPHHPTTPPLHRVCLLCRSSTPKPRSTKSRCSSTLRTKPCIPPSGLLQEARKLEVGVFLTYSRTCLLQDVETNNRKQCLPDSYDFKPCTPPSDLLQEVRKIEVGVFLHRSSTCLLQDVETTNPKQAFFCFDFKSCTPPSGLLQEVRKQK